MGRILAERRPVRFCPSREAPSRVFRSRTSFAGRWQYVRVHQLGSHIILETPEPSHHRIAVPARRIRVSVSIPTAAVAKLIHTLCVSRSTEGFTMPAAAPLDTRTLRNTASGRPRAGLLGPQAAGGAIHSSATPPFSYDGTFVSNYVWINQNERREVD